MDAIACVVDCLNIDQALQDSTEAVAQIERADILVFNKLDLVDDSGAAAKQLVHFGERALPAIRQVAMAIENGEPVIEELWADLDVAMRAAILDSAGQRPGRVAGDVGPSAYARCFHNVARAAAEQWLTIFAGLRPPRLVNPDAWDTYRVRFEQILGQPDLGETG